MPNAVNRCRPNRRPTRRPRRNTTTSNSVRISTPNGIPDRLSVKLPYSDTLLLTTSTVPSGYTLRNSIWDPDLTGTGHQPFMRDQWATLYNRYRCYGFAYEMIFENTSASSAMFAVAPFNHTGAPSSMTLSWEKPNNTHGVLGPAGSATAQKRITGFLSAAQALQVTKQRFNIDDIYSSAIGSNPSHHGYLTISTQAVDKISSVTVQVVFHLTMYATLYERATVGLS